MIVTYNTAPLSRINEIPIVDGQLIAVSDHDGYYYDMGGVRRSTSGISVVTELPVYGDSEKLYMLMNGTTVILYTCYQGTYYPLSTKASNCSYNNEDGELDATNVQDAIDEVIVNYQTADGAITRSISGLATLISTTSAELSGRITALSDDIDPSTELSTTSQTVHGAINELKTLIQGIHTLKIKKVDQLPATGEELTLYFVHISSPGQSDAYDEYMWIDNEWELVGSTRIDLTDYVTLTGTQAITNKTYEGYSIGSGDIAGLGGGTITGAIASLKSTIDGLALGDLSNVSLLGLKANQTLKYNGTAWINSDAAAGSLSGLSDVTLSSPEEGQILGYADGKWKNIQKSASSLAGMSDTQISSPSTGQALVWNGSKWANETISATVLTGTLAANATTITFTSDAIKSTSLLRIYAENKMMSPKSVGVSSGSVTYTFKPQTTATNMKLEVVN